MNSPRKRLDALLVERGLASGRERAKEQIRAGHVRVDGPAGNQALHPCECRGCPYL